MNRLWYYITLPLRFLIAIPIIICDILIWLFMLPVRLIGWFIKFFLG